jgi:anti-sigma B factor antagonist
MPAKTSQYLLEVEEVAEVTVVHFRDRHILDDLAIEGIGRELARLTDRAGRNRLLLSFGNVEHLSSAMLGKILHLEKRLRKLDGRLALCQLAPAIAEAFAITGLHKVLNIYPDEQQALLSF